MSDKVIIFITAPNEDVAASIAKDIVESRLAACANIIRNVRSIYRWQGKIEDETEVLMVIKTRSELFSHIEERVKKLHPYTVPEIIAIPLIEGSPEYLGWLEAQTDRTGE